jgi:hypothetical protein
VIGTSDCLWGLLDGMNSDGLAVSLTFGGAKVYGPGFGIPLVIRYLLEVAGTVSEALTALRRIPVSMSYNVTLTDRDGCVRTAYLAPGQPMEVRAFPLATNHRFDRPVDPVQGRRFRSLERQEYLLGLLHDEPHPTFSPRSFCGNRCVAATTPTGSAPCTPPTTAQTPERSTIDGRAPPGPGHSTRRTPNCDLTFRPHNGRRIPA